MSVVVQFVGRLGNNLFQYSLGRIIASQLGLALECWQSRPFTRSIAGQALDIGASARLADVAPFFPNAPLSIPGLRVETPVEKHEFVRGGDWEGHWLDIHRILDNPEPRQIRLRGWFQRLEYYSPHRLRIKEWFRPLDVLTPHRVSPKDVLVNIRRGADYGLNGWTLPLAYYDQILSSMPAIAKVYVCGTCLDEHVKNTLAKYNPIYYDATPIEHFVFMMRFRRIVLSNSTFAWWAAYLSEADEIYAPRLLTEHAYSFSGYSLVDLHMREPRYHEVVVKETVPLALFRCNENLEIRSGPDEEVLVLGDPRDGPALRVDEHNRELLHWLVSQIGPVTLSGMLQHCDPVYGRQIIEELIGAGALSVEQQYLDV